jgi:hypothetical protein
LRQAWEPASWFRAGPPSRDLPTDDHKRNARPGSVVCDGHQERRRNRVSAALGKPYFNGAVSESAAMHIVRGDQAMTIAPAIPARAREQPVAHRGIVGLVGLPLAAILACAC